MAEGRSRVRNARRKIAKADALWDPETLKAAKKARKEFYKRCCVCNEKFYLDTVKPEARHHYVYKTTGGRKLYCCLWCKNRNPERIVRLVLIAYAVAEGKPVNPATAKKVLKTK
jgi:hypothetical protein